MRRRETLRSLHDKVRRLEAKCAGLLAVNAEQLRRLNEVSLRNTYLAQELEQARKQATREGGEPW